MVTDNPQVPKIVTFSLQVRNLLRRYQKLLAFHLIVNIYFGPNLSEYCSELVNPCDGVVVRASASQSVT